jgi:hypothetical protein
LWTVYNNGGKERLVTETTTMLRELLQLYGIDDTTYSDEQLELIIRQARAYIGEEFVEPTTHEDYVEHFRGKTYMTSYYPVDVDSVTVICEEEVVIPNKITSSGLVYFTHHIQGRLTVSYTQELTSTDIRDTILPIAVYMIRDIRGENLSSITEGDVSVSYDNTNTMSTSGMIQNLVTQLRNKYKARVRLL